MAFSINEGPDGFTPRCVERAPQTPDETIRRLTAELREARDQRAAATEILEIINSSPGDLTSVLRRC